MAETQLDRIEEMLKLQIAAKYGMDGTEQDIIDLREKVKKYKVKKV